MKLVAQLQLLPTPEQQASLRETLQTANAACNRISDLAWEHQTFGQYRLHHLSYHLCRQEFPLAAQMVVRSIAKVADAYKRDKKVHRRFRPTAAQPFDDRIFRFVDDHTISLWTTGGRQKMPFVCGTHQRGLLAYRQGEVDLCLIRGKWYIFTVCDVPGEEETAWVDALGVDLGIVNLAVDSDGTTYSGTAVEEQRRTFTHRRRNLQRNGSRAAHRKLQQLKGKQARYQKDVNHCISKAIVATAQRTARAIGLEDLTGIRERVTARRRQRSRLSNWGFAQLRQFVTYKAILAGVALILVDPRNTSRTCPDCGHIAKANRRTRDTFVCQSCGLAGPADDIAARNIRARAVVKQPMVARTGM
jgi:IS605 OrfB family transposase